MARTMPALLLLTACASPSAPRLQPAVPEPTGLGPAKVELPTGARLRLLPLAVSGTGAPVQRAATDGLWRHAMRQSPRVDIAAGLEDAPSPNEIVLHLDASSRTFTTSLRQDGRTIPLASERGAELGPTLDQLAWRTRTALGEFVTSPPVPTTSVYSASADCVRLTEEALRQRTRGDETAALRILAQARGFDGGSPVTLLHLAATHGRIPGTDHAREAFTIARDTLTTFQARLTPEIEHRLARVVLLAQNDDAKLLELARAYRKDRPHDPHAGYSEALALGHQARYDAARPLLTTLAERWPRVPEVRYQLAFACLGTGDPDAALVALEAVRRTMPPTRTARPYAMALFHSGAHDELRRFLEDLRRQPGVAGTGAEHEVLRMQASHAILLDDKARALTLLASSLEWIRRRPSDLLGFALVIAEDGEVLARLGGTEELRRAILAFQELGQLPSSLANVLAYLGALLDVDAGGDPSRAMMTLRQSNDTVWHNRLQAAIHHRRGELSDEIQALLRANQATTSPVIQANFVRVLRAAGRKAEADQVAVALEKRLLTFDQRQPREHPLMSPGRALAYRAITP